MEYATATKTGDFSAYIAWLTSFLGDQDPRTVMGETPRKLREATRGLERDRLRIPEAPGKWSILEVVQHLVDTEWNLGVRIRKMIAEPGATVNATDQDAWARELAYREVALEDALEEFTLLRRANLRFYERMPRAVFERAGIHPERGEESAGLSIKIYAAHDLYHLGQIGRIKEAIA